MYSSPHRLTFHQGCSTNGENKEHHGILYRTRRVSLPSILLSPYSLLNVFPSFRLNTAIVPEKLDAFSNPAGVEFDLGHV